MIGIQPTFLEVSVFHEYRDLISKLKHTDHHFERLFNEHNELDKKIDKLESRVAVGDESEIEVLKKKKLALKDEIFTILRKASAEH